MLEQEEAHQGLRGQSLRPPSAQMKVVESLPPSIITRGQLARASRIRYSTLRAEEGEGSEREPRSRFDQTVPCSEDQAVQGVQVLHPAPLSLSQLLLCSGGRGYFWQMNKFRIVWGLGLGTQCQLYPAAGRAGAACIFTLPFPESRDVSTPAVASPIPRTYAWHRGTVMVLCLVASPGLEFHRQKGEASFDCDVDFATSHRNEKRSLHHHCDDGNLAQRFCFPEAGKDKARVMCKGVLQRLRFCGTGARSC